MKRETSPFNVKRSQRPFRKRAPTAVGGRPINEEGEIQGPGQQPFPLSFKDKLLESEKEIMGTDDDLDFDNDDVVIDNNGAIPSISFSKESKNSW